MQYDYPADLISPIIITRLTLALHYPAVLTPGCLIEMMKFDMGGAGATLGGGRPTVYRCTPPHPLYQYS
jgi:hypothetical protein